MKFKDYVEALNKLVAEHPECLEFDVVYSEDDEGNNFERVNYTPSLGYYNESEYAFVTYTDFFEEDDYKINSVCIN